MESHNSLKVSTPTDTQIIMERVLDIPRYKLFYLYLDPKGIQHWWGPKRMETVVEQMEVKKGGNWKFINIEPSGEKHVFFGEFKEIDPINKITWTFNYEPFPDDEVTETIEFIEISPESTKIRTLSTHKSKESRDGMLNTGMADGFNESLNRLLELELIPKTDRIIPCLWFKSEAEEAANFYLSIFRNSRINSVNREEATDADQKGKAISINLTIKEFPMVLINGNPKFDFSVATSHMIYCDSQEEIDFYWERLSEGGTPSQCGWIHDKYGVTWQIIPRLLDQYLSEGTADQRKRVTEAFLRMNKFIISDLSSAYNG